MVGSPSLTSNRIFPLCYLADPTCFSMLQTGELQCGMINNRYFIVFKSQEIFFFHDFVLNMALSFGAVKKTRN